MLGYCNYLGPVNVAADVATLGARDRKLTRPLPARSILVPYNHSTVEARSFDLLSRRQGEFMATFQVFDPPMCCATGVCGPSIDPELARFASDLEWLRKEGLSVERFNLSQQPGVFAQSSTVASLLTQKGNDCLPLVLLDGRVVAEGTYPSREVLAAAAGIVVRKAAASSGCCGPSTKTSGGSSSCC